MILKLIENIKHIDKKIINLMLKGFKFSLLFCILANSVLLFYYVYPFSYILIECSFILFKTGIIYLCTFFICAFVTNSLK